MRGNVDAEHANQKVSKIEADITDQEVEQKLIKQLFDQTDEFFDDLFCNNWNYIRPACTKAVWWREDVKTWRRQFIGTFKSVEIGTDQTTSVGGNQSETIGGNQSEVVSGNKSTEVGGEHNSTIGSRYYKTTAENVFKSPKTTITGHTFQHQTLYLGTPGNGYSDGIPYPGSLMWYNPFAGGYVPIPLGMLGALLSNGTALLRLLGIDPPPTVKFPEPAELSNELNTIQTELENEINSPPPTQVTSEMKQEAGRKMTILNIVINRPFTIQPGDGLTQEEQEVLAKERAAKERAEESIELLKESINRWPKEPVTEGWAG